MSRQSFWIKTWLMALAAALLLALPAHADNVDRSKQGQDRAARIARIEDYLTGLTTLQADFTQIAPDGSVSNGIFYLKRPGKMRWQYKPPTPVLMISDGHVLTFYDSELEQVSYVPIDETLAGFLGREKISFEDDRVAMDEFTEADGMVRITIHQTERPDDGKLMLEFSDSPLQLRNLVITDGTGQTTHVALSGAKFGLSLDAGLFIFHDPRKPHRS